MKHLRLFETELEFNQEKRNFEFPVVSFTKENGYLRYFREPTLEMVKVTYHLDGTEKGNIIGSGELYNLIDTMYVDGQLYDIDDLIVVGVQGSGSGSGSGATVGYIALPNIAGSHTVEFNIGYKMFEEKRHIQNSGIYNWYNVEYIPYYNSVEYHANGHDFVDLGLPSGRLWATMNVGATYEGSYGNYFMWASTTPDDNKNCVWENTPYCINSSFPEDTYSWSKYNKNGDELDLTDDAASQLMGGSWVMPSRKEFKELIDNTTHEWVEYYMSTGLDGMIFRSKKDLDKHIFIPAGGEREGSSNYSVYVNCNLWSRSLRNTIYEAYSVYVDSQGNIYQGMDWRSKGKSVRGVL